jgi:hypothetical protein
MNRNVFLINIVLILIDHEIKFFSIKKFQCQLYYDFNVKLKKKQLIVFNRKQINQDHNFKSMLL